MIRWLVARPLLHQIFDDMSCRRAGVWTIGVLVAGLVLNSVRWKEGPVVFVIDERREYGLHRMDVIVLSVAFGPLLMQVARIIFFAKGRNRVVAYRRGV